MRFNCNDIDIILDGLDDYRGLCEYDEEAWEKITKVMDKVRVYADQILDCELCLPESRKKNSGNFSRVRFSSH